MSGCSISSCTFVTAPSSEFEIVFTNNGARSSLIGVECAYNRDTLYNRRSVEPRKNWVLEFRDHFVIIEFVNLKIMLDLCDLHQSAFCLDVMTMNAFAFNGGNFRVKSFCFEKKTWLLSVTTALLPYLSCISSKFLLYFGIKIFKMKIDLWLYE